MQERIKFAERKPRNEKKKRRKEKFMFYFLKNIENLLGYNEFCFVFSIFPFPPHILLVHVWTNKRGFSYHWRK